MDAQLVDFMGILVVGTLISLFVQWVKAKLGTSSLGTKLVTIGLSILIGGVYFLFRETAWYATMLGILTAASTVYALILKQ